MHYTQPEVYEFISKQTGDPIVERKTCAVSGTQFPIFQSDVDFYERLSPTFDGTKPAGPAGRFLISTPTLCPEERQRRRLLFRNERNLYRKNCDATKRGIITLYSPVGRGGNPDNQSIVYDHHVWRGDGRDPHAVEYQEGSDVRSIFSELLRKTPKPSLYRELSENSQYTNNTNEVSDCYLCFSLTKSQNTLYTDISRKCNGSMDLSNCVYLENCYDAVQCTNITNGKHLVMCASSSDLEYCTDCLNCTHCTMCVGLKDATYHILNQPYSKEDYFKKINEMKQSPEEFLEQYHALAAKRVLPAMSNEGAQETYGNFCYQSVKSTFCFDAFFSNTNKYIYLGGSSSNCQDCQNLHKTSSYIYDSQDAQGNFSGFLNYCKGMDRCRYMTHCYDCQDCFGCVGVRNKQYCLFNVQYTKEDYEKKVSQVIASMQSEGLWGEFFDPSLSPFGYNETVAQEYYPLTKQEALDRGYHWSDYDKETRIPDGVVVLDSSKKTIEERGALKNDESVLNQIIICEVSGKPFRIIKQELELYRKNNLPIPTKHPDVRYQERLAKRPGRTLYLRTCDKTGEEMVSVYCYNYQGRVYSEQAYQEEVYG